MIRSVTSLKLVLLLDDQVKSLKLVSLLDDLLNFHDALLFAAVLQASCLLCDVMCLMITICVGSVTSSLVTLTNFACRELNLGLPAYRVVTVTIALLRPAARSRLEPLRFLDLLYIG
jgi:hypothetical protein